MLSYYRCEAGQYHVNYNSKMMVGYVKKQSSSKWVLYKTANPSILGNPVAVTKTLKDLKVKAEEIFSETTQEDAIEENLDAMLNQIRNDPTPDKKVLMEEMLEKGNVLEFNQYKVDDDNWEEVKLPGFFGKFLTKEQVETL
jgi:hypothetical protein